MGTMLEKIGICLAKIYMEMQFKERLMEYSVKMVHL